MTSSQPITLNDETLGSILQGDRPVLILFTTGEGLRGDFKTAFDKAAANAKVVLARVDPTQSPQAAAQFGAGDKPMLVGVYCGEEIVRRLKPWGSDLPLALEMLDAAVKQRGPQPEPDNSNEPETPAQEEKKMVVDKPVTVTDATFEQEVLQSDLPVLVDFWAEWCGPCRMVGPILDKLAKEFAGQIKITKVNVDENPNLSQAFRIQSIPNLMIVKQRTMIFNQPGALPEASLRDLIQQAIALEIRPQNAEAEEEVEEEAAQ